MVAYAPLRVKLNILNFYFMDTEFKFAMVK